jgi:hypothetical protein
MINFRLLKREKRKIFAVLLVLFNSAIAIPICPMAAAAEKEQTVQKTDEHILIGRWERPDGGYVLELREIRQDGNMKAAYFNPRSINVARAEWSQQDGKLSVCVELRDVNYPGSKYNLQYDPASDSLKGTYFQAVAGETYEIEFLRIK